MKKKLLIVMLCLFVITGCSISPILSGKKLIRVDGQSMLPTLKDGDLVFYKKVNELNRFDIVVFKYDNVVLIQRIYGLPNETVTIKNGIIYINDEKIVDDKYAYGDTTDISKITLGDDEYFVLGDNRKNSRDSRSMGPIKKENIRGVVLK